MYIIRGQQVMLDKDLAELYGYEVKRLNEQVKRNISRFPEDFMFQLNKEEIPEKFSKSRIATLNEKSNRQGSNIKQNQKFVTRSEEEELLISAKSDFEGQWCIQQQMEMCHSNLRDSCIWI